MLNSHIEKFLAADDYEINLLFVKRKIFQK